MALIIFSTLKDFTIVYLMVERHSLLITVSLRCMFSTVRLSVAGIQAVDGSHWPNTLLLRRHRHTGPIVIHQLIVDGVAVARTWMLLALRTKTATSTTAIVLGATCLLAKKQRVKS
jgi:hypothetical protein